MRSGMIEYVADGTMKLNVALMLRIARATPRHRRVALLGFGNSSPWATTSNIPLARLARTTGDARFDMGGPGNMQGAVRTCSDRRSRLIVTVCAR